MVPGVKPYYMISNYGRLWHKYKASFLNTNIDAKGYLYKPLATIDGSVNIRIHRLVMLGFCYIPGCENMIVNHIDGNKCNCAIWNLEWSNYSENVIHAYNTGLNANYKISDDVVHKICKDLEDHNNKISNIAAAYNVNVQTVSAIANKRSHCDISDQYNIRRRKIANNFTIDQVKNICKFFEENKKNPNESDSIYCARALRSIGITDLGTLKIRTALKILKGETYQYISRYYNF